MALSGTDSRDVLKRIVFIDRVLAFATNDIEDAFTLSTVTTAWKDSFDNYGHSLWRNIVYVIKYGLTNAEVLQHIYGTGNHIHILQNCIERGQLGVNETMCVKLGTESRIDCIKINPLMHATEKGQEKVLRLLLRYGANKEYRENDDSRPLHIAAKKGHIGCMRALIEDGCEKNPADVYGSTPLHYAYNCHNTNCAQYVYLLDNFGEDINKVNNFGETPLQTATRIGIRNIVFDLIERCADIHVKKNNETLIHLACRYSNIDLVKIFLKRGVDRDAQNNDDDTALHIACNNNSYDIIDLLLENDANPCIKNKQERTVSHIALCGGNAKMAKIFTDSGALNKKR